MEVRLTELSGDAQYFIDCAQEASEMDGCTAMTLRLYGEDARIMAAINAPREHKPDGHYKNRRRICISLAEQANSILMQLTPERAAGLIALGMRHLTYEIGQMAETMSYMCIEDEIDGGCLEPYRRERARCTNGITWKRTARRLMSPKFIRRYVKSHAPEDADHLFDLHLIMMWRARCIVLPRKDDTINADYRAQTDAMNRRNDERRQQLLDEDRASRALHRQLPGPRVRLKRGLLRKRRKVIRRSFDVAVSMLGADTVRSFVHGEAIKLIGRESLLILQKRGSLTSKGHGAMSVAIADKNGTTVADLCTYIEDTPTLDQLVGFALWMNAGEDRAVLNTANIIQIADGQQDHPLIADRRKAQREQAMAALNDLEPETQARIREIIERPQRRVQRQLDHDERRARNDLYWERTKGEWQEALFVAVIGYRNFPFYRMAGAL